MALVETGVYVFEGEGVGGGEGGWKQVAQLDRVVVAGVISYIKPRVKSGHT